MQRLTFAFGHFRRCYDRAMLYRLSVIGLGLLGAGFLGCGRTDLDGPFATIGKIPITTGAAGGTEPTGAAGAAGRNTGEAGATTGEAGASAGSAGSSSTGEAGGGEGGQAGSLGQGGSSGTGAAGSSQGGSGGTVSIGSVCDPVAQNCGPGLRCDLPDMALLAFQCIVDAGGTGGEAQTCQVSSQDCAKGSTCIQPVRRGSGIPIGPAMCFVFCNADADCPSGSVCSDPLVFNQANGSSIRAGICQIPPPNNN
jgi:hypothetical protein